MLLLVRNNQTFSKKKRLMEENKNETINEKIRKWGIS